MRVKIGIPVHRAGGYFIGAHTEGKEWPGNIFLSLWVTPEEVSVEYIIRGTPLEHIEEAIRLLKEKGVYDEHIDDN